MKVVSFEPRQAAGSRLRPRIGIVTAADRIVDVSRALLLRQNGTAPALPDEPLDWFDVEGPWWSAMRDLDRAVDQDPALLESFTQQNCVTHIDHVRLHGPVPRPGKILCVGLNYRDHAAEVKQPLPESPVLFSKASSCVVGHLASVVLPRTSDKNDYEAELAVVGYMNANDVTARDFQKRDGQWVRGKSCDTFAPCGPWLVSAERIADPNDLSIQFRLNGRTMQQSRTREFVFDVGHVLAFTAATTTLEPGDVILTGTPPGVGYVRQPPVYLAAGDVMEVEVEGLGVLRNTVVAPA
jgi:2,4-diketo-3-deoxy-L-fuconate hydrolase